MSFFLWIVIQLTLIWRWFLTRLWFLTFLRVLAYNFRLLQRPYTPISVLRTGEFPRTTLHHAPYLIYILNRSSTVRARVIAFLNPFFNALIMEVMIRVAFQYRQLRIWLERTHANSTIISMLGCVNRSSGEWRNNSWNLIPS